MSIQPLRLSAVVAVAFLTRAAAAQSCAPDWSPLFACDAPNNPITAATLFDADGDGPLPARLVIAGFFTQIAGRPIARCAQWNGYAWEQLGDEITGSIHGLTVFDEDGSGPMPPRLAACGTFTQPIFSGLAVLSSGAWQLIPMTSNAGAIVGTTSPDPALGALYIAGSAGVYRYANGSLSLIGPTVGGVAALAFWDDDGAGPAPSRLLAGGSFASIGGAPADMIAAWDGQSWSEVGGGLGPSGQGYVYHMLPHDADGPGPVQATLLVVGDFASAGALPAERIAAWDGAAWSAFPGLQGWIGTAASFDLDGAAPQGNSIIVSGGLTGSSVQRWTGSSWAAVGGDLNMPADVLLPVDPDGPGPAPERLLAAGLFTTYDQAPVFLPHLAQFDGQNWVPFGPAGLAGVNDLVHTITAHDEDGAGPLPPYLAVGGRFTLAGTVVASGVARWNGAGWAPLGAGFFPSVQRLASLDLDGTGPNPPQLVVGRHAIQSVSRWDGASWTSYPSPGISARAFAVFDHDGPGPSGPSLFAAGSRQLGTSMLVRWTGSAWAAVSGPQNSEINDLAVADPDDGGPLPLSLILGGRFTSIGTLNAANVVAWDGAVFTPMGAGLNREVGALCLYDEDGAGPAPARLFAGGSFTNSGLTLLGGIARWSGSAWTRVGTQPTLTFQPVNSMTVHDFDGPGPAIPELCVVGLQGFVSGLPSLSAGNIAAWNGTSWRTFGGLDSEGYAVASFEEDRAGDLAPALYASGRFRNAGGHPNLFLARYGCPAPSCYPNCDGSVIQPALNVADLTCFLQRFAAGDGYANCDHSTTAPVLNAADFTCFLQQFAAGCD